MANENGLPQPGPPCNLLGQLQLSSEHNRLDWDHMPTEEET